MKIQGNFEKSRKFGTIQTKKSRKIGSKIRTVPINLETTRKFGKSSKVEKWKFPFEESPRKLRNFPKFWIFQLF